MANTVPGQGVNHAFFRPTGRLRLVDQIYDPIVGDEGPASSREDVAWISGLIAKADSEKYEWWSLAGPDADVAQLPMETRVQHRWGDEFAEGKKEQEAWFEEHPKEKRRLKDYVGADIALGLLEEINTIGWWHGVDMGAVAGWQAQEGVGRGDAWTRHLPSALCEQELIAAKMKNPQWRWTQHDLSDIHLIAASAPYVDILGTEKQWVHALKTAKLDARFGARFMSNLEAIADLLPT